jgi:Peptidase family M28
MNLQAPPAKVGLTSWRVSVAQIRPRTPERGFPDARRRVATQRFGGEELGLLGSAAYIDSLSSTELSHIGYDLDADVFGTPNYIIGVLDPAAPDFFGGTVSTTFPNRVYKASKIARDQAVDYFDSVGLNHEFLAPTGTDAFNFNLVGIPASGLLTGQDCCKSQHEVDLFGGFLGNYEGNIPSFDGGCVDNPFRRCDNIDNVDKDNMTVV